MNGPLDLCERQVWGHDGQGEGSVSALHVNRETGMGVFAIANSNYLDESQNYSLVDLDMHLMAWFEECYGSGSRDLHSGSRKEQRSASRC